MSQSIDVNKDDLTKIKKWSSEHIKNMREMKSPLERISILLFNSVQKNFKEQGTDKGKWKKLSPFTLWVKRNRKSGSSRRPLILQDTGRLRGSIVPRVGTDFAQAGTNVQYAKLHQKGGKSEASNVEIKSTTRTSKLGNKYKVSAFTLHIRGGHNVPKRPFLTIRREYKDKITNLARNWFFKGKISE